MKIWLAILATLLVSFARPAAAEEGAEKGSVWAKAFQQVMAGERLNPLSRLHPAALARRGREPGLALEDRWQEAPLDCCLVVTVHGFYSNRDRTESFLLGPAECGHPVGRFEYASNRSIEEAIELLSKQLCQIAREQPEREVALVTHSLGGVIARAVLENPQLDPGNVTRLVMIAPPNHGSALADIGLDARPESELEQAREAEAVSWGRAAILKTVGPVVDQVRTDSEFLNDLNARPRNPNVRYSIFLGTKGIAPPVAFAAARAAGEEADRRWRLSRWVGDRVKAQLGDLKEFQHGAGDGVVSVESGRLDGVDDVVLLPFRHSDPLWHPEDETVQQLYRQVLSRLQ